MTIILIVSVLINLVMVFVILLLFAQQKTCKYESDLKIDNLMKENSMLIEKVILLLTE